MLALLLLLSLQIGLGMFAVDVDGLESGPLSRFVSFDRGRTFAEWHETTFNVLLAFIALHVLAVIFHLIVHRQNLIASMIHGRTGVRPVRSAAVRFASPLRAIVGIALAAASVWLVVRLG